MIKFIKFHIFFKNFTQLLLKNYTNKIVFVIFLEISREFIQFQKIKFGFQLMRIGSKSLVYAKDVVAEAAVRGQQQLVNQLQR